MDKKVNYKKISPFKMTLNIITWTALAILILIVCFVGYYIIAAKIYNAKGEKYTPRFALYTIISPSMEPNINVYDVIFDQRIEKDTEIKKGDIITFISTSSASNNLTVTHRVIEVVETPEGIKYRTKGDNNLVEDGELAPAENVIGKVMFKIPQLGRIQFFLSSKGGWLVLVVLPALGILIYDIMNISKLLSVKRKAKNRNKKIDVDNLKESESTFIPNPEFIDEKDEPPNRQI